MVKLSNSGVSKEGALPEIKTVKVMDAKKQRDSLVTKNIKTVWDLYKIGDSKKFRESLANLGVVPDKLIAELKGHTQKYLRDKIKGTVFKELPRIGAEKRVFESDALDFVVGFEYSYDVKNNYPPTGSLPATFNIAYERGGGLVGRIFYLQNVNLKYLDSAGQQREITVPYLLVQEKLIEFGKKIEELNDAIWRGIDTDKNTRLVKNLLNQFIETNKEMYRRGFMNWDVKISVNYGVTKDNRVVLLDTGGITVRKETTPIVSWYVSLFCGVKEPNYEEELSQKNIQKLWETDLNSIARSAFVNPELEKHL
ncbi:MAG: hypothetical protein QME16_07830 [Planctomycetota bacterium]|nr:hypothetical protein [Planctomycetota bacterium]